MSQTLAFGEQLPSKGNIYLKVKQKGDKVQFRIAQNPSYIGKHFIQKEDGWDVPGCPRINSQEECEMCELYFKGMAEAKKYKENDEKKYKELEKEVRKYKCSITFYFPVLNRDVEAFAILQTTQGVRNKINEVFESGVDIFKKDFVLRNTGSESPRDIYSVVVVDSADTKPFTDKEKEEFEKAKAFDMETLNDGFTTTEEE